MKKITKILVNGFILAVLCGCMEENISPLTDLEAAFGEASAFSSENSKAKIKQLKATGLVQIVWNGGKGKDNGNQPEEMLAFAGFEGFEPFGSKPAKGSFVYQVMKPDLTVHREITANLTGVVFGWEGNKFKAWMVGEVISDNPGMVCLKTRIGGIRIVDMLTGEQLPRIC